MLYRCLMVCFEVISVLSRPLKADGLGEGLRKEMAMQKAELGQASSDLSRWASRLHSHLSSFIVVFLWI